MGSIQLDSLDFHHQERIPKDSKQMWREWLIESNHNQRDRSKLEKDCMLVGYLLNTK